MRLALLILVFALNTFAAGPISFGIRGGVPFGATDSVASSLTSGLGFSSTRQFAVGPTVGIRLPLGFSIEGDALFHRQTLSFGQFAGFNASAHSDSWEFPLMLKFTGGRQAIAPVFGAGAAVRHINEFGSIPGFLFNGSTSANTTGFVAGAGLRFQLGPVNVTPEIRYTRWGGNSFSQSLLGLLPLSRNEAAFLVGLTF